MMKNTKRIWLGWDLTLVGVALGLVACDRIMAKDAFLALQIKQVQVLAPGDCTVPGTPTSSYMAGGTLDLGLPDGSLPPYLMPLSVANNLASAGGGNADEMNNITLTHFTVELSASGVAWDATCPAKFDTQSFSFLIGPGGSTGASLYALTSSHSLCLRQYVPPEHLIVTASVVAKGRHGGTAIESAPLVFPIEVCLGCLQQDYFSRPELLPYRYPADTPACSSLIGDNPFKGAECKPPGQDGTILCCQITSVVGGVSRTGALCPGAFTGSTNPDAGTP